MVCVAGISGCCLRTLVFLAFVLSLTQPDCPMKMMSCVIRVKVVCFLMNLIMNPLKKKGASDAENVSNTRRSDSIQIRDSIRVALD